MEAAVIEAQTLSTEAWPEPQRLKAWREFVARSFGDLDVTPLDDQPFRAQLTFFGLPGASVAFSRRSDCEIDFRHGSADPRTGAESISLILPTHGRVNVVQGQWQASVGVDGAATTIAPGRLQYRDGFEAGYVNLPLRRVLAAVPSLDPRQPVAMPAAAVRHVALYLSIIRNGPLTIDADLARAMSDHLFDLAILALGARGDAGDEARERGGAAAQAHEVLRAIDSRVADPNLSLAGIAGLLGLPEAEVRRIFDGTGDVFEKRLEERRLDLAMQRLHSPAERHLSVAEIARLSGFPDVERFRRRFRVRFGDTPEAFRARPLD